MSNPYFVASGQPATGAFAASAPMRSEFSSIEDGFDLLPALTANTAVVVNSAGTALTNTTGTLALAGNFATAGAFAITLTATAGTAVTLPTTGTLATLAGAETLSNKTLVAPALGTPVSGVATNLTGTAAGLTAGTVTTNANLSGPISSVGNTTSITAQTGTGTTFVVQTAPTINSAVLVTPALGTPASGNLANCTGLPASGVTTGTLAAARGGTGVDGSSAGNGRLLIGNGTGYTLATLTAGTNITITNDAGSISISAPGSVDYSEIDSVAASGSAVVFTGITSEDIIIYVENVSISSGNAQLTVAFSIDGGSTYVTSAIDVGGPASLTTSGRYTVVTITGAKAGVGQAVYSASTLSASAEPNLQNASNFISAFWLGASVNAIRVATSASTFAGGTITLQGRG